MTDLKAILRNIVHPAIDLLGNKYSSDRADQELLSIGMQESRFKYRHQIGGPAVSFWQFEKGGGIKGVLGHKTTLADAGRICQIRNVKATPEAVYQAMQTDDILGCAFARLLLWSDPHALPDAGDSEAGWQYYLRNWRPGKPHRDTWDAFYTEARIAVSP